MKLGAFSVSLSVKDLEASRNFYEKFGFTVFAGKPERNYYIMKNGETMIGLFKGMFPGNLLTFNPGWDQSAGMVEDYDDIRKIQQHLKDEGLQLMNEVDENSSGPGSFMIADPDGNMILVDQHVA